MTDADIRRWLAPQCSSSIGHVSTHDVFSGAGAVSSALAREEDKGHRAIVVDAIRDEDLMVIGKAAENLPLITGGSGIALGLPANFGCVPDVVPWQGQSGETFVLSGSCSIATRAQVAYHASLGNPVFEVTAEQAIEKQIDPEALVADMLQHDGIALVSSSADPDVVMANQNQYGRDACAHALESLFARIACIAVQHGVSKLITAGGETSGAVVEGLNVGELHIGPEIAPGVPALRVGPELTLALKCLVLRHVVAICLDVKVLDGLQHRW